MGSDRVMGCDRAMGCDRVMGSDRVMGCVRVMGQPRLILPLISAELLLMGCVFMIRALLRADGHLGHVFEGEVSNGGAQVALCGPCALCLRQHQ